MVPEIVVLSSSSAAKPDGDMLRVTSLGLKWCVLTFVSQ